MKKTSVNYQITSRGQLYISIEIGEGEGETKLYSWALFWDAVKVIENSLVKFSSSSFLRRDQKSL